MGGIALTIVGAILTSMLKLYFAGEYTGEGIVGSRLWWEVALNLQILSAALMWFCYADRIDENVGAMRRIMQLRMWFGLFVVFLPLWMAILSFYLNWFEVRPPIEIVNAMIYGMVVFWAIATLLPRILMLKIKSEKTPYRAVLANMKPTHWYSLAPTYFLVVIWIIGLWDDSVIRYQYAPIMLYFQAAVPYFETGVARRRSPSKSG